MNKITFSQFLAANGLPPVGEIITTPRGDRVEVVAYVYDMYDYRVRVRLVDTFSAVVDWSFEQAQKCTWEGK
jgi:hypothetical protein